jgi:hypothetical protein
MGAGKKRKQLFLASAGEITRAVRAPARVGISVKVAYFDGPHGFGIGGNLFVIILGNDFHALVRREIENLHADTLPRIP